MLKTLLGLSLASLLPLLAAPTDDPMGWTGVLDEQAFAALHELRQGEAPELFGEEIELGEGRAYLSLPPDEEPIGALVVIHEWWGLNANIKHWSDRLAADGYIALAVDLYGGEVATTRDEAMGLMQGADEDSAMAVLLEAHRYLDEELGAERTASIGWCFGGGWSLRLAMAEPELDAAILYYGRLVEDPDQLAGIEASVLGIFGERDRGIPPEAVERFEDAMVEAGREVAIESYEADHAFANPSSARYDDEHAASAWQRTRAFLCETLWPRQPGGSFSEGTRELEAWVPDGWSPDGPRPMRNLSYAFNGAECYVTALRGDGGGVEPNLNRWLSQMGEDSIGARDIEELPHIPMFGQMVPSIRIEGSYTPFSGDEIPDAVMLGAICALDDEVIFVKMVGDSGAVDAEAHNFIPFCRGLR